MVERYQLSSQAARDVQAYVEYNQVMGDGPLLSPQAYGQHKQALQDNQHKRVFGAFLNSQGMECKAIGPASKCFCDHRLKDHNYLSPGSTKGVKCSQCNCKCFLYLPTKGSQDLKCNCKHSYRDHDCNTKKCRDARCKTCSGFRSSWGCGCGDTFDNHRTVFETYQDRLKKGKPVDDIIPGGFMALADGIDKQEMGMPMLPAREQRMLAGPKEEGGVSAYDLFNTPVSIGGRQSSQRA